MILNGAALGSAVGFPLGGTLVDPHDAAHYTMMAGILTSAVGLTGLALAPGDANGALVAALALKYLGPPLSSILVSEYRRKSRKAGRVAVGLTPHPQAGITARASLRF